jgi:DNA modification methylase
LIYVDPPFFSNRHYEIIWGNGYELRAFEDRWKGGIQNYIAWMEPKIRECHRILKQTGSMYLHCDWHANAHLRILMDKIFGEGNFRNEIVWERSHSRSSISKIFRRAHDVILLCTKSNDYTFNQQFKKLSHGSMKLYQHQDQRGKYQPVPVLVSGIRHGETGKPWHGIDPSKLGKSGLHWVTKPLKLEEYDKKGLLIWPKKAGGLPRLKYYLDDNKGVPVSDVWTEVGIMEAGSNESLGYPTQKPEKLLERIISTSSNPMDIILDPMCGCGTAISVAHRLGRRWIGVDVSPTACKVMIKRMQKLGVKIAENDIVGLPKSVEELKDMVPFEFQNWVTQKLYARPSRSKVGDFGVDGWLTDGRPLQIKQSEDIGRNVVDNFETAIRRQRKKAGMIVAFSFGKGANEEVARAKQEEGLKIELKAVEELVEEI